MVGDFVPSLFRTKDFEFAVKYFNKGDREREHFQITAREVTVIVFGNVRIGNALFSAGDVCLIEKGEPADFEAFDDGALAVIKFPSDPDDKVFS